MINGISERGVGVDIAAQAVDQVGGGLAGITFASLKQHVFKKMREAATEVIALMDAAGLDPGLNRNRRGIMLLIDIYMQAVVKSKTSDIREIIFFQQLAGLLVRQFLAPLCCFWFRSLALVLA